MLTLGCSWGGGGNRMACKSELTDIFVLLKNYKQQRRLIDDCIHKLFIVSHYVTSNYIIKAGFWCVITKHQQEVEHDTNQGWFVVFSVT